MNRFRSLTLLPILAIFLAIAPYAWAQHWRPEITDVNMSLLVMTATLDGDELVAGDEVGAFTRNGLMAGATAVGNEFPVGFAAFGDDVRAQGINGFVANEPIAFKVWDHEADEEFDAEPFDVDGDLVWVGNGFTVLSLRAARGPGAPEIELSDGALDFGEVRVGQVGAAQLDIHNVGNAPLTVESVAVQNDAFATDFDGASEIAAGEFLRLNVTFTPDQTGEFAGRITITSDDEDEAQVTCDLAGVGADARPPNIQLSAFERRFGRVLVGQSRSLSLFIANTGDQNLVVSRVVSGNNAFTTDFNQEVSIGAGDNLQVNITFSPGATGVFQTDLTITSNDPDQQEARVALSGEGIEEGEAAVAHVTVEEHFYGGVVVGQFAAWRMVVTNNGGSDLFVNNVSSNSDNFQVDFGNDTLRLRPGDYLYVNTAFVPDAVAFFDGIITVSSDDEENGSIEVPVSGVGLEANGRHFQAYNTGSNHTLLVQSATFDGNNLGAGAEIAVFTDWGLCAGVGVVNNRGQAGIPAYGDDESTDIVDGFSADEPFSFKVWDPATRTEAWGVPEFSEGPEAYTTNGLTVLTLAANVGEPNPDIQISADDHFFGQVQVGGSEDWVLTVTNQGRGVLHVTAIDPDLEAFSTNFEGEFALELGESQDIVVTFEPGAQIDYEGRLTIMSDDPVDSVLYVDVFGVGVDEVREPDLVLGSENYFFGAVHIDTPVQYTLNLENQGAGLLRLISVAVQGDNAFTTNWPGNPRNVAAGEAFQVVVTFRPGQSRPYNADLIIVSDDPDNDTLSYHVEGDGSADQTHYLNRITDVNHSLLITETILNLPGNRQAPFGPRDEIAVFTESGLCAGVGVVQVAGEPVGFPAMGDDRNSEVIDGFANGESFTFMMWDFSTQQELEAEATVLEGDEGYVTNGFTVLRIEATSDVEEAQIAVDPMVFNFGPIRIRTNAQHVFHIQNSGGVNLTVSRIVTNSNAFTHNFNNQPTVIQPGGQIDVTITFTPQQAAVYEPNVTVFSNDPDQPEFIFHPAGAGSDQEGHFDWVISNENHSVLVSDFRLGGSEAQIGDEVGAFTPSGFCAGSGVVSDPGQVGFGVMGDDRDTDYMIEGFRAEEEMTFKVWDFTQQREYENIELDVVEGDLVWESNGFTVVTIDVEGVISMNYDSPDPINEFEEFDIRFTLNNAQGQQFQFSWQNPNVIPGNAGNRSFTDNGNNTANFRWTTNGYAAGEYFLQIRASNQNITEQVAVRLVVLDVNQRPVVANPFQNDLVAVDEDSWRAGGPRLVVVPNLNNLFNDPDGDRLSFIVVSVNPNMNNGVALINNLSAFWIEPALHFSGDVRITLRAEDNRQVQHRAMRNIGSGAIEAGASNPGVTPSRDLSVDYTFTLRINEINDVPVITQPANADVFRVNVRERTDWSVGFQATDVEDQVAELRWDLVDRGDFPNGLSFQDNGDGTARMAWQPAAQDIRAAPYVGVVRVRDTDNGEDRIRVEITVINVNDPPVIGEPVIDTAFVDEDCERTIIETLSEHFTDPDQDQMNYGFVGQPLAALRAQINAGTGEISIWPNANYFTPAQPPVITAFCADRPTGQQERNEVRVNIVVVVRSVNDTPTPNGVLAPVNRVEDSNLNRTLIIDLDNRFRDVDAGDQLRYVIGAGFPAEVGLLIDANNNQLSYQLAPNFNTWFYPNHILTDTIYCFDLAGADTFQLLSFNITPVNDLPLGAGATPADTVFRLLLPAVSDTLDLADTVINIAWAPAVQNPWEIDQVRYRFAMVLLGRRDTTFFEPLLDTAFVIGVDTLARRYGGERDSAVSVAWWVSAVDTANTRFWARRGPRSFTILPLEVKELPDAPMPDDFFLSSSYPNPFNGRTTLTFGISKPGNVDVSVWDMHGRKVAELAAGYHTAGQYELVWTADGMTSGIYLIKMQSGTFLGMQKAILVR
jgi:hypothetical protein